MAITEQLEEQIVVGMFDRGLLIFPDIETALKSDRDSPYYYNDRPSLSFSSELDRTGVMTIARQKEFREALVRGFAISFLDLKSPIDHVFGKAQSATSPAAVGAYEAGLSYLWERVDEPEKTYGAHRKIEGTYEPDEYVGIGDDVVTDGKSKKEAAKTLRNVGLVPVSVTIKFDREEGGMEALQSYGFEANTVTGLTNAVKYLVENSRIGNREVDALHVYHQGLIDEGLVSTFSYSS